MFPNKGCAAQSRDGRSVLLGGIRPCRRLMRRSTCFAAARRSIPLLIPFALAVCREDITSPTAHTPEAQQPSVVISEPLASTLALRTTGRSFSRASADGVVYVSLVGNK